ncbi:MAG: DDE transposase family protein [Leptolyngbyaceae cyanobacterium CRU_2_3]|nr:DDE transposase family protein [Leptolyngbyaceae cyanobacterium CRU_2_3]
MANSESWYIVRQPSGHCEIIPDEQRSNEGLPIEVLPIGVAKVGNPEPSTHEPSEGSDKTQWGPFASQGEAIARRVGLIRSGKCQPL